MFLPARLLGLLELSPLAASEHSLRWNSKKATLGLTLGKGNVLNRDNSPYLRKSIEEMGLKIGSTR